VRDNTLYYLKGIDIPSADTILRGDVELSVPCEYIETSLGKENKINVNTNMNSFSINSAIAFNQLKPKDKNLIYGFDHQFILADKYGCNIATKISLK